jgi:type II restriction/modification system DNA methylase subunit YeeA
MVTRDHAPFNRNLGPLIIYECSIYKVMDQLLIIDVCAFFFENFTVLQYLFFAKVLKSPKKPLSGIRKKF